MRQRYTFGFIMAPMSWAERFLVTGGAGFIGSGFLQEFVPKYPTILFVCIDKLSYASKHCLRNIENLSELPNFKFVKTDLANYECEDLDSIFAWDDDLGCSPLTVVNFAAETSVDRLFKDPAFFLLNNSMLTSNLLDRCRKLIELDAPKVNFHKVKFIHISTDEVYGETEDFVDEGATLTPSNPYSALKVACDMQVLAYNKSYKVPAVILRPNNVYGPNQHPEKIIPMTISRLSAGKSVTLHGDGSNKRSFLHVSDFVNAIELVWKRFDTNRINGEIFNIGTKNEISNHDLVKLVAISMNMWDSGNCLEYIPDRRYNDRQYRILSSKIEKLGWKPVIEFAEGLKKVIKGEQEILKLLTQDFHHALVK